MDFGDIGLEVTETATADAIAKVRAKANTGLKITGTCYNENCGDDCPEKLFCSVKCRDAYEKTILLKGRLGHG